MADNEIEGPRDMPPVAHFMVFIEDPKVRAARKAAAYSMEAEPAWKWLTKTALIKVDLEAADGPTVTFAVSNDHQYKTWTTPLSLCFTPSYSSPLTGKNSIRKKKSQMKLNVEPCPELHFVRSDTRSIYAYKIVLWDDLSVQFTFSYLFELSWSCKVSDSHN